MSLFAQVLRLCAKAGLGRVGVVAIDGTKIAANASAAANRTQQWLREQAERIVAEAEQVDAEEDVLFGDRRGDEFPPDWADRNTRDARVAQALADLDAEDRAEREQQEAKASRWHERMADPQQRAKAGAPPRGVDPVAVAEARLARTIEAAKRRVAQRAERERAAAVAGTTICGTRPVGVEDSGRVIKAREALARARERAQAGAAEPAAATATVAGTAAQTPSAKQRVRNLTDPDSRLMPARGGGWMQGYNAQLAVTEDQIIVAAHPAQTPADAEQFVPMMSAATAAAQLLAQAGGHDQPIGLLLADAGYLSTHNLTAPGPDRLIAVGKQRDLQAAVGRDPGAAPAPEGAVPEPITAMTRRLQTQEALQTYKRRSVMVDPVNGHLKDRVGLRRFAARGLSAATAELQFAAAVANLRKLFRATVPSTG